MSAAPVAAPVASPCISVCRMDDASGLCTGCLRTLDEIAAWAMLDDAARRVICAQLPRRRVALRAQMRAVQLPGAGGNGAAP